ncbi:MAG TPA: DHA2 family efflux MFS transporter permease subunit [Candidatus Baltobacteraceae bacterium]|jgi:DHA2 family multidrug resistance protein|nr:DHA2 family efflux MFS transporter permease subunit [Candidatus Baltobacteraceae bacterium]
MSAVAQADSGQAAHAEWRPRVNPWLIAPAVMLATFMEVLDTSIASVALPYIAGNLGATSTEATWVLTSYLVSNAIVLPASAWFSSVFGRKRFLISCIIIFTASSFLCGSASSLALLIVARTIQGAGGGALQPLAQSILLESFPPAKRGVAMAVYGVGVVCAPILGPTLGGWLTDTWSWRWAFYINVPIGILAVIFISLVVDDPPYIRASRPGRIDGLGFGFMAIGLATLQIALDKGQEVDWFGAIWFRWVVLISVLSLLAFVIRELCAREPIVNLRILKNRNFAIACALFFLFGAAIYGLIALQPLFLQLLLGYTALDAGLTVSPRGIGALGSLAIVGILIGKVGGRMLAAVGFVIFAYSAYLFSQMTLDISMSNIVPANIVNGIGTGFIFVPLTTVGLGTLRNDQMGNAAGIQNLLRNIGGSVGISIVSTMLDRFSQMHQVYMTGSITPLNPIYQQRVTALSTILQSHFTAPDARTRAQAMLYNLVHTQTSYWAFIDLFFGFMWVAIVCAVLVWFLKRVVRAGPVAVH